MKKRQDSEQSRAFAKAVAVFRKHGAVLRTTEVIRLGVHPRVLYAMRDAGVVFHIKWFCLSSTIRHVDRILVPHKGCLVEEGTHEQLLAHGGIYAKLYQIEFKQQEEEEEELAAAG